MSPAPRTMPTVLLCGLSLAIGWGIRGNFGHEYGAMIPGALAALAACCMAGREDWLRRAPHIALFGALGWAFGGSASYMQVIAYTHSGHLASQLYGFACLFVLGALWGGLGGAGTAFAAVASREQLTAIYRPMLWVFAALGLLTFGQYLNEIWLEPLDDPTWNRHESLVYWLDSDWLEALAALIGVCAFDLWDRRGRKLPHLAAALAAGACAGGLIQLAIEAAGLAPLAARVAVRHLGDLDTLRALPEFAGQSEAALRARLFTNLPNLVMAYPHAGWAIGLAVGAVWHFRRHGAFRSGASLIAAIGAGWYLGFLLGPVVLGLRMTPPRGDNWAGLLGVYLAALWWLRRNGLAAAVHASLAAAIVGGLGFSGAAFLKLMMVAPGNPAVLGAPPDPFFAHWQHANWHSFLEQTYGFINGIGIALAMLWLARRQPPAHDTPGLRRWTDAFAAAALLCGVTFLNVEKNVEEWVAAGSVPPIMRMPLVEFAALPARVWFCIVWALMTLAVSGLIVRHRRRPIAFLPQAPLGRAQLLYLVFLWTVAIANFERALPRFDEQRILTEGTILVHAILATVLIAVWPPAAPIAPPGAAPDLRGATRRMLGAGTAALLAAALLFTIGVRLVYGSAPAGHAGLQFRFGEDAQWRIKPLLRGKDHA